MKRKSENFICHIVFSLVSFLRLVSNTVFCTPKSQTYFGVPNLSLCHGVVCRQMYFDYEKHDSLHIQHIAGALLQ